MMKFLVKRKDDGRVARIEIEEVDGAMIYDLLEASKSPLQFDQDAILCAYSEGDSKALSETTYLSDIKEIKLLIIKVYKKFLLNIN